MSSGINWHSTKPSMPVEGDAYYDIASDRGYIYRSGVWLPFIFSNFKSYIIPAPTNEQLEKHPSLKEAWEHYRNIRKLLGI